jgi:hypothetical protein
LYLDLFLISVLSLFFEMVLVRWLSAEVRLFSYFKNLAMMAAFLGLGLGFAVAKRPADYAKWFMPILLFYVPIVLVVSDLTGMRAIIMPEGTEYVWRTADLPAVLTLVIFIATVLLFFLLTLFLFVPLGQLTGRLMMKLPSLRAYQVNLLGSLAGIGLFTLLSFLDSPPWLWFGLSLPFMLWFLRRSSRSLVVGLTATAAIIVLLIVSQSPHTLWSPYYRLDIFPSRQSRDVVVDLANPDPEQVGYGLLANQVGFMESVNLSSEYIAAHPEYDDMLPVYRNLYDLPYAFARPAKILIVGAGMGNDAAAALRHGVQQIDAVEIDPVIYHLGMRLHPEHPYDSPKVRPIIDDARSYLEKTDQRYDMIVFGILDAQTLLSGMSSVRLDNFVYTVESLRQARERLAPQGIVALTFDVERPYIRQRLAETLLAVFGQPPLELSVNGTRWVVFVAGTDTGLEQATALCSRLGCTVQPFAARGQVPLATDDWPYLYLETHSIPTAYWVALIMVVVIAWLGRRRAFPESQGLNWHFFFLGCAFLLIEFKIITELALLFGSTWIVNSIGVAAVLLMVLLANLTVQKARQINFNWLYVLLLLAILLGVAVPLRTLLPYGVAVRILGSAVLLGLPLFFASMIFSTSLRRSADITTAFGSNFLGSAVGGALEYASLVFGIGSLYLLGAILYVASWVARPRQNKSPITIAAEASLPSDESAAERVHALDEAR